MGPVALVGSGEFLPGMEELDRRLLVGRPQRVVHLPTAAGEESERRLRYWRDLARRHFEEKLEVEVETLPLLDAESANDPGVVAGLGEAGLVYLSGGNPGYLAAALRGSAALARILDLWRDGTALAGCSAGAAALTAVAPDVRAGRGNGLGLGIVPGLAIVPHYDKIHRWRPGMARKFAAGTPEDITLVGVDEHTAIVSDDLMHYEVYGAGTAVKVDEGSSFGAGDSFEVN